MKIRITWCTDDVLSIRPNLTEEQAYRVLLAVEKNHDANIGINWEVLAFHADNLFPQVGS